jgi:hypothetical protein
MMADFHHYHENQGQMDFRYISGVVLILLLNCCEKVYDPTALSVDQITYGDCKSDIKKSDDPGYIEYFTVDADYLQINHINAWFNCEPGHIFVSAQLIQDTIAVEENEETLGANCICPYDLSYRIGPLNYGRYVFRMERGDIEFSINFNSSTSGVFSIE